jgi:hypothetical protein
VSLPTNESRFSCGRQLGATGANAAGVTSKPGNCKRQLGRSFHRGPDRRTLPIYRSPETPMTPLVLPTNQTPPVGRNVYCGDSSPARADHGGAKARAAHQTESRLLRRGGVRLNSHPVLPDHGEQVIISRYSYQLVSHTRWIGERPGDASLAAHPERVADARKHRSRWTTTMTQSK